MSGRIVTATTRRRFLATSAATTLFTAVGGIAKPFISRANDRPAITHGLQSGDVSLDSGVVWARADRPSRMLVEFATTDSFKNIHSGVVVDALPEGDFVAKVLVDGLPAGQDIFYRARFQDLTSPTVVGEPTVGHFRTAPSDKRSISFVWSGDTAGQGWGHRRGARRHAHLRRHAQEPAGFLHPQRRHHLRRRAHRRRGEIAERPDLAEHRNRRQIEAGRNPRRVSRQL
jgi:alkaline phosphatase D